MTAWDDIAQAWRAVRQHAQALAEQVADNLAPLTTEYDDDESDR